MFASLQRKERINLAIEALFVILGFAVPPLQPWIITALLLWVGWLVIFSLPPGHLRWVAESSHENRAALPPALEDDASIDWISPVRAIREFVDTERAIIFFESRDESGQRSTKVIELRARLARATDYDLRRNLALELAEAEQSSDVAAARADAAREIALGDLAGQLARKYLISKAFLLSREVTQKPTPMPIPADEWQFLKFAVEEPDLQIVYGPNVRYIGLQIARRSSERQR